MADATSAGLAATVSVADVTLREHGQNVPATELQRFTVDLRVQTARALIATGVRRLEVLSCVSPRRVPAMDPDLLTAVARGIGRPDGVRQITLVPNRRGLESFLRLGLGPDDLGHTAGVLISAVEGHNRANLGTTIAETRFELKRLAAATGRDGVPLAGYVSGGFGWRPTPDAAPIPVPVAELRALVAEFFDLGCVTVTVSDLQGLAGPTEVRDTLGTLLAELPKDRRGDLGYHPHHAEPRAGLALAAAALDVGIRLFDGSLGATGGCITGAPGNVPTEGLLALLEDRGVATGIDRAAVEALAHRFHSAQTEEMEIGT